MNHNDKALDIISCQMDNNVLVQKSHITDFNAKSQVVVYESQEAIFFKDGQALDLFLPGRHDLNSDNLPMFRRIFGKLFGGDKTPFPCEVFFINKAYALDLQWGTGTPITVTDPQFQFPVAVKSNGTTGIKVKDSRKFVVKIVGPLPEFTVETVRKQIKGMLMPSLTNIIADTIVHEKVGILEIATKLEELSVAMQERLNKKLDDIGLEAVHFNIGTIFADDNDMAQLKAAMQANLDAYSMGVMSRARAQARATEGYTYQEEQKFKVLETAAGNTGAGGGMVNAGVGLGMGLGMMGEVGRTTQAAMASAQAPTKVCPQCSAQLPANAKFCSGCGAQIPQAKTCPNCANPVEDGAKFCPHCGQALAAAKKFCPDCGTQLEGASKFCPECGHKF